MKKIKIALIGYGNRGRLYSSFIKDKLDMIDYVAITDFRANEIRKDIDKNHVKYVFDNVDDFFKANLKLDLVMVCSMDKYHYKQTKECILHGYNVLLEKPVSNKLEEVEELLALANKHNVKVIVTYVLRYTVFYRAIKDIIDSKKIGEVVNINTTENVAYWHYAHSYDRGNWKDSKETGPMILTKCSHDMDLVTWLVGKKPIRISSFGGRNYLRPIDMPEGSSDYCTDCKLKNKCAFNAYYFYHHNKEWLRPMVGDKLTIKNIDKFLDHSPYSRCAYDTGSDVVDHQIVNIEYEDNVTVSHTMNAYTRFCYRDIKVMGTKGQIEGNFEKRFFDVYYFNHNRHEMIDINKLTDDFVGHGGGDRVMFNELIDYLSTNKKSKSLTTLEESYYSNKLCFLAEKSRIEKGKVLELKGE